jgi:hypothetical protein
LDLRTSRCQQKSQKVKEVKPMPELNKRGLYVKGKQNSPRILRVLFTQAPDAD